MSDNFELGPLALCRAASYLVLVSPPALTPQSPVEPLLLFCCEGPPTSYCPPSSQFWARGERLCHGDAPDARAGLGLPVQLGHSHHHLDGLAHATWCGGVYVVATWPLGCGEAGAFGAHCRSKLHQGSRAVQAKYDLSD